MSQLDLSDLKNTDLKELDVTERYSKFAPLYDELVNNWGYQCYSKATELLQSYVGLEQPILDAGCGTGLAGQSLQEKGYQHLTGIDISSDMLERARQTGCYHNLQLQDLSDTPYPFADNQFAAITCIGVFSLIVDPLPVLQEFSRILQAGGYLVFTQQEVLFNKYGYADVLQGLEQRKTFKRISISEPVVYLPHREGYEERTVIYFTYQICKDA
ncbi:MAG: class I SAM-dependent methyltransferase [Candidatus Electrothrix sp. AUS3]|nr:class I SAM-dependent methyltransferase [Candidatus Electrothrix gigas]